MSTPLAINEQLAAARLELRALPALPARGTAEFEEAVLRRTQLSNHIKTLSAEVYAQQVGVPPAQQVVDVRPVVVVAPEPRRDNTAPPNSQAALDASLAQIRGLSAALAKEKAQLEQIVARNQQLENLVRQRAELSPDEVDQMRLGLVARDRAYAELRQREEALRVRFVAQLRENYIWRKRNNVAIDSTRFEDARFGPEFDSAYQASPATLEALGSGSVAILVQQYEKNNEPADSSKTYTGAELGFELAQAGVALPWLHAKPAPSAVDETMSVRQLLRTLDDYHRGLSANNPLVKVPFHWGAAEGSDKVSVYIRIDTVLGVSQFLEALAGVFFGAAARNSVEAAYISIESGLEYADRIETVWTQTFVPIIEALLRAITRTAGESVELAANRDVLLRKVGEFTTWLFVKGLTGRDAGNGSGVSDLARSLRQEWPKLYDMDNNSSRRIGYDWFVGGAESARNTLVPAPAYPPIITALIRHSPLEKRTPLITGAPEATTWSWALMTRVVYYLGASQLRRDPKPTDPLLQLRRSPIILDKFFTTFNPASRLPGSSVWLSPGPDALQVDDANSLYDKRVREYQHLYGEATERVTISRPEPKLSPESDEYPSTTPTVELLLMTELAVELREMVQDLRVVGFQLNTSLGAVPKRAAENEMGVALIAIVSALYMRFTYKNAPGAGLLLLANVLGQRPLLANSPEKVIQTAASASHTVATDASVVDLFRGKLSAMLAKSGQGLFVEDAGSVALDGEGGRTLFQVVDDGKSKRFFVVLVPTVGAWAALRREVNNDRTVIARLLERTVLWSTGPIDLVKGGPREEAFTTLLQDSDGGSTDALLHLTRVRDANKNPQLRITYPAHNKSVIANIVSVSGRAKTGRYYVIDVAVLLDAPVPATQGGWSGEGLPPPIATDTGDSPPRDWPPYGTPKQHGFYQSIPGPDGTVVQTNERPHTIQSRCGHCSGKSSVEDEALALLTAANLLEVVRDRRTDTIFLLPPKAAIDALLESNPSASDLHAAVAYHLGDAESIFTAIDECMRSGDSTRQKMLSGRELKFSCNRHSGTKPGRIYSMELVAGEVGILRSGFTRPVHIFGVSRILQPRSEKPPKRLPSVTQAIEADQPLIRRGSGKSLNSNMRGAELLRAILTTADLTEKAKEAVANNTTLTVLMPPLDRLQEALTAGSDVRRLVALHIVDTLAFDKAREACTIDRRSSLIPTLLGEQLSFVCGGSSGSLPATIEADDVTSEAWVTLSDFAQPLRVVRIKRLLELPPGEQTSRAGQRPAAHDAYEKQVLALLQVSGVLPAVRAALAANSKELYAMLLPPRKVIEAWLDTNPSAERVRDTVLFHFVSEYDLGESWAACMWRSVKPAEGRAASTFEYRAHTLLPGALLTIRCDAGLGEEGEYRDGISAIDMWRARTEYARIKPAGVETSFYVIPISGLLTLPTDLAAETTETEWRWPWQKKKEARAPPTGETVATVGDGTAHKAKHQGVVENPRETTVEMAWPWSKKKAAPAEPEARLSAKDELAADANAFVQNFRMSSELNRAVAANAPLALLLPPAQPAGAMFRAGAQAGLGYLVDAAELAEALRRCTASRQPTVLRTVSKEEITLSCSAKDRGRPGFIYRLDLTDGGDGTFGAEFLGLKKPLVVYRIPAPLKDIDGEYSGGSSLSGRLEAARRAAEIGVASSVAPSVVANRRTLDARGKYDTLPNGKQLKEAVRIESTLLINGTRTLADIKRHVQEGNGQLALLLPPPNEVDDLLDSRPTPEAAHAVGLYHLLPTAVVERAAERCFELGKSTVVTTLGGKTLKLTCSPDWFKKRGRLDVNKLSGGGDVDLTMHDGVTLRIYRIPHLLEPRDTESKKLARSQRAAAAEVTQMLLDGDMLNELRAHVSGSETVVIFVPPADELKRLARTTDRALFKQLMLYHVVPLDEISGAMVRAVKQRDLSEPINTLAGWTLRFDGADKSPDADPLGRVQFADFVRDSSGNDLILQVPVEALGGESVAVQRIRRPLQPAVAESTVATAGPPGGNSREGRRATARERFIEHLYGLSPEEREKRIAAWDATSGVTHYGAKPSPADETVGTKGHAGPTAAGDEIITPGQELVPGGPTYAQTQNKTLRELARAKTRSEALAVLARLESAIDRSDPAALRTEFSPLAQDELARRRLQALAANVALSLEDKTALRAELDKFRQRVRVNGDLREENLVTE